MSRRSSSSGHAVRWLTPAEADHDDRWGLLCSYSAKCRNATAAQTSYSYVTGRAGRTSWAAKRVCTTDAEKFATRHGVTIAADPAGLPAPDAYRNPSYLGGLTLAARKVSVRPSPEMRAGRWVATKYDERAQVAGTIWLTLDPATRLESGVLAAVEKELAAKDRLMPTTAWDTTAKDVVTRPMAWADLAKAEDTPQWADTLWTVTVHEEPATYDGDRPTWIATLMLAPQFKVETIPLGNHNMTLDRAIRTATTDIVEHGAPWLGHPFTVGEWTTSGSTATTSAHRRELTDA